MLSFHPTIQIMHVFIFSYSFFFFIIQMLVEWRIILSKNLIMDIAIFLYFVFCFIFIHSFFGPLSNYWSIPMDSAKAWKGNEVARPGKLGSTLNWVQLLLIKPAWREKTVVQNASMSAPHSYSRDLIAQLHMVHNSF